MRQVYVFTNEATEAQREYDFLQVHDWEDENSDCLTSLGFLGLQISSWGGCSLSEEMLEMWGQREGYPGIVTVADFSWAAVGLERELG